MRNGAVGPKRRLPHRSGQVAIGGIADSGKPSAGTLMGSRPSERSGRIPARCKINRTPTVCIRVELEPALLSPEPRLGLFWFIAQDRGSSRLASLSRPFSQVTEVAGFKTLDEGHVDVWPTVQRLDQTLVDYDYDYFPRGRVNWRKEDDRWLLALDPKLNRAPFIAHIVFGWKIPRTRLLTLTDAHYRSLARVGPPQ